MDLKLHGKKALVGGGSKGIGRAIAIELLREGADVVVVSRSGKAAGDDELADAHDIRADLGTAEGCDAAVAETLAVFGQVDFVVANAGGPPAGEALGFDDAAWLSAFETNLLSVVRLARLTVPAMKTRNFGRFLAVTSISAVEPIDGLVLSNSLRTGVHGFLKSLSRETAAQNVTVNALAPGYTATDRLLKLMSEEKRSALQQSLPSRRFLNPAELGRTAAWLLSEAGSAITGSIISCDAGSLRSIG